MSNGMEKEVRDYLKKVLATVSLGLLWLLINSTAGIMFGQMFIKNQITAGNIIFYSWFIISFAALIYYYTRLWKKKTPA
jgi:hypothetical protein